VKYRGVEYQVVQTISGDFRWSIQGVHEKYGLQPRRDAAIAHVKNLIDGRGKQFPKPSRERPFGSLRGEDGIYR